MDMQHRQTVTAAYILLFSVLMGHVSAGIGHYRCTWHTEPDPSENETSATQSRSSCSGADSFRLTSYINHCTKQDFVPLIACREDGTWNCQSFIAMCKTVIHTASVRMTAEPASPTAKHDNALMQSAAGFPAVERRRKLFNPDENYFTMKEMFVAVLVSFMTGGIILALVIWVVWRCRNSHVTADQVRDVADQSAKRIAALHAITHIAQAFSASQDTHPCTFSNPNYGQLNTSRESLEDSLSDHDRMYEEVLMHKSGCRNPECIYVNMEKVRKKRSIVNSNSSGDLKPIAENGEQFDLGYEADSNITPQSLRRQRNNFGHMIYNVPRSPTIHTFRTQDDVINADLLRNTVSYMSNANKNNNRRYGEADNGHVGLEGVDEAKKDAVNKCDSGYIEEIADLGSVTNKLDDQSRGNTEKSDDAFIGERRKDSLRL